MANTLRFKRGLVSGIPTAALGEPLFTTDTFDLYIGNGTGNTRFQKYIASGTTSQLLRGDGSLLTMPIVLTSPSNGQVLKYNGTSWVNDSDAGITGSGTTNYLPKFTGASTLGNSLLIDNGTDLRYSGGDGIRVQGTTNGFMTVYGTTEGYYMFADAGGANGHIAYNHTSDYMWFKVNALERMRLTSNGRLLLGSTTDNGLRFQVTGDGYFSGSVGIGTTSITDVNLYIRKSLSGSVFPTGIYIDSTIQSTSTSAAAYYTTSVSTQATTFTLPNLYHFRSTQGTFGAGSTVTNQYGFFAGSTLTGATNNYGFFGDIPSGTGRWNLFMNGTANNYMAGSLGIGTTTLTGYTLAVGKNITGSTNAQAIRSVGIIQSDVTSKAYYYTAQSFTANANFALPDLYLYAAFGGTLSNITAGGSITSQYGYFVDASLTGATNNYGFYGNIASGTGRWNLYMNGSAANYVNGNTLIGEPRLAGAAWTKYLVVGDPSLDKVILGYLASSTNGATIGANNGNLNAWANLNIAGSQLIFRIAETERMRLDASGNLGLGVTPSAWISTAKAMQLGSASFVGVTGTSDAFAIGGNYYINSSNQYVYLTSTNANRFEASLGEFRWLSTGSGTAGDVFTFTQRMTLTAAGRLLLGSGAATSELMQVNGTMRVSGASTFGGLLTATATIQSTTQIQAVLTNGTIRTSNADNAGMLHIRPNSGQNGYITFTEDSVSNRWAIGVTAGDGTFYFRNSLPTSSAVASISSTGAATFSGTVTISGGNGYQVINSAATTVTALRPTGGGSSIMSTNSNGLHIAVGTQAAGDLILASNNTERIRLSQNGFFSQLNATNPSASITDSYIQYSADVTAGNAAPHFRTENGAVIKLYQETTAVGNAIVGAGGGSAMLDDDTFDGYTLRQVVRALRNQGILQ